MKFVIGILLFCVFIISGCKDPATKTKTIFVTDTTKVTDTLLIIRDSVAPRDFIDSVPSGLYHGTFPCDGCDGIQQIIAFDEGKKFRQEELFWGKQTRPTRRSGSWEKKDGVIWLNVNGRAAAKLKFTGGELRMVEQNGKPINTPDSGQYLLKKAEVAQENPAWKKKQEQGVEFVGIGTEPFWSLEIDKEKFILFKLADWKKAIIIPIEAPRKFADSTVYTVASDNKLPLRITIYQEFGSDGMSDFLYEYKVIVRYMGEVYTGRGIQLGALN